MEITLKYMQWLIFWFRVGLLFSLIMVLNAAATANTAPLTSVQDFAFAEPEFETLRNTQAIDNQPITALAQDARGLIWIGTQQGLFRYDGYRFRQFVHKAGRPFSLAGDYVHSLSAAKDGRLWVGTIGDGISVFDPASERFENFRHDDKVPDSLGGGVISALIGDGRGGMWIATDQGLDHLSAGSKRFVHSRHGTDPRSLMNDKVRSLLLDKAGSLWVGGSNGLQRLSRDGKSFETVVAGSNVQTLFEAKDGKLWLGTLEHGAAWLMPGIASMQVNWLPLAQLSRPRILAITQVKTDQIWLTTDGGGIIVVAAGDGHVQQTLRHDPVLPGSLALDTLKPLLLDRAGWLWVGTWGGGLQRMNANDTLRVLRHSPKRPNELSHPDIKSVLELADGRLLIGSGGNGIDIFDRQHGLIGGYRTGQGRTGALPDGFIYALAQTGDGAVWAGTQQAGVVRKLAGSTDWVAVPGLPVQQVTRLFAASDGSVWAGTIAGVARWRPDTSRQLIATQATTPNRSAHQTGAPMRFEAFTDEQGKVREFTVNALAEDGQGRVWIGTNNGLWLHEPGHNGLVAVPAEPNRPDGLVSNYISSLLFDSHERLWVATSKGLERLLEQLTGRDGKLARFEHVNALLGLDEQELGGDLLEDRQGRIWRDNAVIDPASPTMRGPTNITMSPRDGMGLGSIWAGSHAQTRDGLLIYGGTDGLAIIDPARFKAYGYAPPLVVTELKINGKAVAPAMLANPLANPPPQAGSGNTPQPLTLTPAQRNFALEFASLDYSEPKQNLYQYRLQGYDKDWINTDADHRSASYGNLWPGNYTLQVRGSNRLGDWSVHDLNIPVRVLPAWWQTWWFGLALLLLTTGLFASLVQMRTRYLRQRQHELEQLVDQRTSQLRQKQAELVDANHELNASNTALNQSNDALSESNLALNDANIELALSVETLRQLGDIGREITANLEVEIVFQSLYLYVGGLLDAPAMTIYRINATATTLDAVFGRDDDQAVPMPKISLDSPTSNAAKAMRERQELLLHYDPLDNSTHIPGTRKMLTALFAPLIVDSQVLGVMSIQSDKQNAYGERERLIFRTLSSYGAIALANATAMAALGKAQEQLVQQEKMAALGGLVAGIAHEINTPLGTALVAISGVGNALQTLQNAITHGRVSKSVLESSTIEGIEFAALALKTANRAAELISLFKTISVNADSDRKVEIELAGYLQEVTTLIHTRLVQNGCKLEVSAPTDLHIHIVSDALTETLSRILVNALDHGFADGRTGTLRIHAYLEEKDEGQELVITVSDDGHGIAPEDLPKVFDPFFTTKSGIHGHVGLGLHVAYNHVTQRLKGQIHITSTLGAGTQVAIRLKN